MKQGTRDGILIIPDTFMPQMFHFARRAWFAVCLVVVALSITPTRADSPARASSQFASGSGNIIYLAAAIGLPLLSDGSNGRNHALRAVDSIGTSTLLSEGLKYLVREKRPDSDSHDSFPSGHATAAFAAATTFSALHPKQAPLWYLDAALISFSRVRLHRHYARDVIAGALIGYGTARLEISEPHGLLLSPLITRDRHTSYGLQMTHGL